MKICIVGAGAIGGMLGVKLALTGHEVTLILRGANLEAVRQNGMTLIEEDGNELLARPARVTSVIAEAGVQDVVILGMKAHQVAAIAAELPALMHETTRVVTMQNGIPWWYFHKLPGAWEGTPVKAVDPDGVIAQYIDVNRVIGSVVYPASEVIRPGVIKVIEGNRFSLGELDGSDTPSIRAIADAFKAAGFKAPDLPGHPLRDLAQGLGQPELQPDQRPDPRDAGRHLPVWPDARTGGGHDARGPDHRRDARRAVQGQPGQAHCRRPGRGPAQDLDAAGRRAGPSARIAGLVAAVMELGRITQTPTPTIDAVYALTSLLANTLQQHKATLRIP